MKIQYDQGGVVYVNLNYLSLVKKFSTKENSTPQLSTFGNRGVGRPQNRKPKKRIKEAARELITLYAKRKASEGYSFSPDTIWQQELEASFFYEDTPDPGKSNGRIKTGYGIGQPYGPPCLR